MVGGVGVMWAVKARVSGHALAAFKYSLNTYKRVQECWEGCGCWWGWCGR